MPEVSNDNLNDVIKLLCKKYETFLDQNIISNLQEYYKQYELFENISNIIHKK